MRSGIATQLSGAMLVSLFSAAWLAADGPCHFMVPAPSRSGPKPTLELNKSEIHPGETVNASGVVEGDFSYVRVAWVWDLDNDGAFESMRTAAVVPLLRGGSYSADIVAPRNPSSGTWTGRLRVGAVVVGAEDADFALADVTLTPAPPGGVSGKVPAEALGEGTITLSLFDPLTSKLVAATTAAEDGSFSFTDIAAGTYRLALSGDLATWVEPEDSEVKVASSEVTDVLLDAMFCGGYSPGTFGVTANDRISYVTADPTAMTDYHLATTWDDLGYGGIVNTSDVFGAYVEKTSADGDALTVTFSAYVQIVGDPPDGVRFTIVDRDGDERWSKDDLTPDDDGVYSVACGDIDSSLEAGTYELRVYTRFDPGDDGEELIDCIGKTKEILVRENPKNAALYNGSVAWNSSKERYDFDGWMPDFGGVLEYWFPYEGFDNKYLGDLESGYQAGVHVEGHFDLYGTVTVQTFQAEVLVKLIGKEVYHKTKDLMPEFTDEEEDEAESSGELEYSFIGFHREIEDFADYSIESDAITLFEFEDEWTVFSGKLASFWGIVSVGASITVGLEAMLDLMVATWPVRPELAATFTPEVEPSIELSIWIELLLGLAKAGATADATAHLDWPITVRIDENEDLDIDADDPCLGLQVELDVWAKVLGKEFDLGNYDLFCTDSPDGCYCGGPHPMPLRLPDAMASPSIAIGPGGRRLLVYCGNVGTPDEPRLGIFARHGISAEDDWEAPVVISDPDHACTDPVVTYFGDNGNAVVAFTFQKIEWANEPTGAPIQDVLKTQEIARVLWDEATENWSTLALLTNDPNDAPKGDGSSAVAGDSLGWSVAWTRDNGDGDISTRNDWRIAVRHFEIGTGLSQMMILNTIGPFNDAGVPNSDPSNSEVSVARCDGKVAMSWTADHDSDPATNSNRRIALAIGTRETGNPRFYTWETEVLPGQQGLPNWNIYGAQSSIIVYNGHAGCEEDFDLAFTARGKDHDGQTETGIGNNDRLWIARRAVDGTWTGMPALTIQNQPIFAEKPELAIDSNGDSVLLFRRFGPLRDGRNIFAGQLAVTYLDPSFEVWNQPLYLSAGENNDIQWQQALGVNSETGDLWVASVSRAVRGTMEAPNYGLARPCISAVSLSDDSDPVQSRRIPRDYDLQVDPQLSASPLHATPGAPVKVSGTIRNVGAEEATAIRVQVWAGMPESGELLYELELENGGLDFNESVPFEHTVTRAEGTQWISIKVLSQIRQPHDPCPENDYASVDLGALPAPAALAAAPSRNAPDSIQLTTVPAPVDCIGGFRWLRSESMEGPFEVVGDSARPRFIDRLVERGKLYYYEVYAYDQWGVLSDESNQATASLPVIRKPRWTGGSDNWSNPQRWNTGLMPEVGDEVLITQEGQYTVTLGQDVSAGSVELGGESGAQTLNVGGRTLSLIKPSVIHDRGVLKLAGGTLDNHDAAARIEGQLLVTGEGSQVQGDFSAAQSAVMQLDGSSKDAAYFTLRVWDDDWLTPCLVQMTSSTGDAAILETPRLHLEPSAVLKTLPGAGGERVLRTVLTNEGTVTIEQDTTLESKDRSARHTNMGFTSVTRPHADGLVVKLTPGQTFANLGTIVIGSDSAMKVEGAEGWFGNLGDIEVASGAKFLAEGKLVQTAGNIQLGLNAIVDCAGLDLALDGGELSGVGRVVAHPRNRATIRPGLSAGTLTIDGAYTQFPTGVLEIEIGGRNPTAYDRLVVTGGDGGGVATLGGTLRVVLRDEFQPRGGDRFTILTAKLVQKRFGQVELPQLPNNLRWVVRYRPNLVQLTVVRVEPPHGQE